MQHRRRLIVVIGARHWLSAGFALLVCLIGSGCGDQADPRFSAETYDEYTETLQNVVIGTPAGVTVAEALGVDGGVIGPSEATARGTGEVAATGVAVTAAEVADAGVEPPGGSASWSFDDCDPGSNFLLDSSGGGANAQHVLDGACVQGVSGLGVEVRTAREVIEVPDEPQFTVGRRVAIAAWVRPNTVTGHQPIVIKRLNNQTSFSLGVHNGNVEMSVVLANGTTVISRAPIAAGVFTHVAGLYDGTFVFLFINGEQFGQVFGGGALRNVFAPVRIGATSQTQRFDGVIDEVFLSTKNITKGELIALSCIARPSTFAVSSATSGPVAVDATVHYDIGVTNHDVGHCEQRRYGTFFTSFDPTVRTSVDFPPGSFQVAEPGSTVTFGMTVTGSEDAAVGTHAIPFIIFSDGASFEQLSGELVLELVRPSCFVSTRQELMITTTSVVDDAVRTTGTPGPGPCNPSAGAWTFGHLMRDIAPVPADAPEMTLRLFQHWLSDQNVNGFTVAARPAIQQVLLDIWPRTATGELDLDQAPLRLQAIVNRIDLRDLSRGSAGEGRFVFAVDNPFAFFPESFTVLVDYNLPARTEDDVLRWANLWHALSSVPFPSEAYNAALENVTREFARRGASAGSVNGSALLRLRTNETALSFPWELRQFDLSPSTGFFREVPVAETPDLRFNGTATFADFVNQNESAILAQPLGSSANLVKAEFEGQAFQAGSAINDQSRWSAPGIINPEARFHASVNTCNGCHGPETGTFFTMIAPRFSGFEATLSPFLTGTTVFDFISGQVRTLNDLARRKADVVGLICPSDGGAPPVFDAGTPGVVACAPAESTDAGPP